MASAEWNVSSDTNERQLQQNIDGMEQPSVGSYVSVINKYSQRHSLTLQWEEGEGEIGEFVFYLSMASFSSEGRGRNKKEAKENAARSMVQRLRREGYMPPSLPQGSDNPVGTLQEMYQKLGRTPPAYDLIGDTVEADNSHTFTFRITAMHPRSGEDLVVVGSGKNKKKAKEQAASNMINQIQFNQLPSTPEMYNPQPNGSYNRDPLHPPPIDPPGGLSSGPLSQPIIQSSAGKEKDLANIILFYCNSGKNEVTALQEILQKQGLGLPKYTPSGNTAPFTCELTLTNPVNSQVLVVTGEGGNKRTAKQSAAREALQQLKQYAEGCIADVSSSSTVEFQQPSATVSEVEGTDYQSISAGPQSGSQLGQWPENSSQRSDYQPIPKPRKRIESQNQTLDSQQTYPPVAVEAVLLDRNSCHTNRTEVTSPQSVSGNSQGMSSGQDQVPAAGSIHHSDLPSSRPTIWDLCQQPPSSSSPTAGVHVTGDGADGRNIPANQSSGMPTNQMLPRHSQVPLPPSTQNNQTFPSALGSSLDKLMQLPPIDPNLMDDNRILDDHEAPADPQSTQAGLPHDEDISTITHSMGQLQVARQSHQSAVPPNQQSSLQQASYTSRYSSTEPTPTTRHDQSLNRSVGHSVSGTPQLDPPTYPSVPLTHPLDPAMCPPAQGLTRPTPLPRNKVTTVSATTNCQVNNNYQNELSNNTICDTTELKETGVPRSASCLQTSSPSLMQQSNDNHYTTLQCHSHLHPHVIGPVAATLVSPSLSAATIRGLLDQRGHMTVTPLQGRNSQNHHIAYASLRYSDGRIPDTVIAAGDTEEQAGENAVRQLWEAVYRSDPDVS